MFWFLTHLTGIQANLEYLHHMTLYRSFTLEHSFGFLVFKIPSERVHEEIVANLFVKIVEN